MLTSQRRTASARAHTDCILFYMTVEDFEEVIKNYPKYYDYILDKAHTDYLTLTDHLLLTEPNPGPDPNPNPNPATLLLALTPAPTSSPQPGDGACL